MSSPQPQQSQQSQQRPRRPRGLVRNKNELNISTSNRPQFYVAIVRNILRSEATCILGGLGNAMSVLVETVEMLKRLEVAKVDKISTSEVTVDKQGRQVPKAKLHVHLSQGKNAMFLSGYRRRKVLELFEKLDTKKSGFLGVAEVEHLHASEDFTVDEDSKSASETFLNTLRSQGVSSEDFVHYMSYIVPATVNNEDFEKAMTHLLA